MAHMRLVIRSKYFVKPTVLQTQLLLAWWHIELLVVAVDTFRKAEGSFTKHYLDAMAFGFATYSWFVHPFRWWRFALISLNVRLCIPSLTSDWNWLYVPGPRFSCSIGKATRLSIGRSSRFQRVAISEALQHDSVTHLDLTLCNSSFFGTFTYTDYNFSISLWITFDCSSLLIIANT